MTIGQCLDQINKITSYQGAPKERQKSWAILKFIKNSYFNNKPMPLEGWILTVQGKEVFIFHRQLKRGISFKDCLGASGQLK